MTFNGMIWLVSTFKRTSITGCVIGIAALCAPVLINAEVLTLSQAIENAEANNRAVRAAQLERRKASN